MATGSFGMDHRAIVWCHGVLEKVRQLVWELTRAEGSNLEERAMKVREVFGRVSYEKDVQALEARATVRRISRFVVGRLRMILRASSSLTCIRRCVQTHLGATKAFAMECAMLYNLPVIFGLHAILAALHSASVFCMPLIATFFIISDFPLRNLVVLTLVTDSIHFLLVIALSRFSSTSASTKRQFQIAGLGITFAAICLLPLAVALTMTGWAVMDVISAAVYVSGIVLACVLSCSFFNPPLAILIVLAVPGILAGTIVLAGWEQSIEARSWWLWIRLVLPVLVVVFLTQSSSSSSSTSLSSFRNKGLPLLWPWLRIVSVIAVVVWSGQGILLRGHAHEVALMVERLLVLEVVLGTVVQATCRNR